MFYTNTCSPVKLHSALVPPSRSTPSRRNAGPDLAEFLTRIGPRGGTPQTDGCWCQFWRLRGNAHWDGQGAPVYRVALEDEVPRAASPACSRSWRRSAWLVPVGPRSLPPARGLACWRGSTPRTSGRSSASPVHPDAKRQGVASRAPRRRRSHAAEHGAAILEGYAARGRPSEHRRVHRLPADVRRRRLRAGRRRRAPHDRSQAAGLAPDRPRTP